MSAPEKRKPGAGEQTGRKLTPKAEYHDRLVSDDIPEAKRKLPLPSLMHQLGVGEHAKKSARCPFHDDQHNSLSIWQKDGVWFWKCHAGCGGGDEINFLEAHQAISRSAATKLFLEMAGVNTATPPCNKRDEAKPKSETNPALYRKLDWHPLSPDMARRIADWRGYSLEIVQWLSDHGYIGLNHGHIAIPVYNELGEVIRAQTRLENGDWKYLPMNEAPIRPLVIGDPSKASEIQACESQWDGFSLIDKLGPQCVESLIITRGASNQNLAGLIPDGAIVFAWKQNDQTKNGQNAADKWLVNIVKSTNAQVRSVPTAAEHKDLNDWTKAGATKEDLIEAALCKSQVVEKPTLPDLSRLLGETIGVLVDHITFASEHQATVLALWVAHSHCIDYFNCTPYLHITSPVKRCGKSNLLTCLKHLTPKAWYAISPSVAVLFRKIERDEPTLLLDEADRAFAEGEKGNQDILAVLNSGYKRGATVDRCGGANRDQLQSFRVFCPKAFAGIGALPDTTQDRCLPIRLERQPQRSRRRFLEAHIEREMQPLRDRFTDWVQTEDAKHKLSVSILDRAFPQSLSDRAVEVCEPLYKIAIAAGGDWYQRIRAATAAIFGAEEDENKSILQLAAIRDAFQDDERLSTADLIDRLRETDDSPFPTWWWKEDNKKSIGKSLAGILKPFGVKAKKFRVEGVEVRGYESADLGPVWERYCPPADDANGTADDLLVSDVSRHVGDSFQPSYGATCESR